MTKPKSERTSATTVARLSNRTAGASKGRPGKLYGSPTQDTDPGEVLLAEIRRTAGHIEWLSANLQNSDPEMFVKTLWLTKRQSGFVTEKDVDMKDWSQAGAMWLELYMTERRHLATICRTALAAGIEERRVRLAERQAERVGEAFRGVLYDIGELFHIPIDVESDEVRSIVFRWLMTASGATGEPERAASKTMQLEIEELGHRSARRRIRDTRALLRSE
jgi:hypothetical protein